MSKSKSKSNAKSRNAKSKTNAVEEDCSRHDAACEKVKLEYCEAIKEKDIGRILKLQYFIEDLHYFQAPILQQRLVGLDLFKNDGDLIQDLRSDWISTLVVGQYIDAYSPAEFKWFSAKILSIEKKRIYNYWIQRKTIRFFRF